MKLHLRATLLGGVVGILTVASGCNSCGDCNTGCGKHQWFGWLTSRCSNSAPANGCCGNGGYGGNSGYGGHEGGMMYGESYGGPMYGSGTSAGPIITAPNYDGYANPYGATTYPPSTVPGKVTQPAKPVPFNPEPPK